MPGVWVTMIPYQDKVKLECECDEESSKRLKAEAVRRGVPLQSLLQELVQAAMEQMEEQGGVTPA